MILGGPPIRTGRLQTVVLGSGDSSKYDLLGSSFGDGGDYVMGRMLGTKRFLKKKTAAALIRQVGGGGFIDPNAFPPGVRPRPDSGPRDRVK
jgi:hypothetical protein